MDVDTPYDKVKHLLPTLTQVQLKDLHSRCKSLITKRIEVDEDWLLEGMLEEIKLHGVMVPPIANIKRITQYQSFCEKSQQVRGYLEGNSILTKLEKRQLAKICTKCLIEHIREFSDVSLPSLFSFTHQIPQALEKAFPGYLFSNRLFFILRASNA